MRITVTQELIDKGTRGSCCRCPVALAIAAQTGVPAFVTAKIIVCGESEWETPATVRDFIANFDGKNKPNPFQFFLEG